jgi:hypothetical protein
MSSSNTKRLRNQNRLAHFNSRIAELRKEWHRVEQRTKYQFTMEYSQWKGTPVEVYPTTLRIVTFDHRSVACVSVEEMIERAKRFSMGEASPLLPGEGQ